jgi:hypothetical protein
MLASVEHERDKPGPSRGSAGEVSDLREGGSVKRAILIALCTMLAVGASAAGELAGVEMPDTVTVEGKTLTLNGMGLREKLWIDVYVAGLYLESKSSDAAQILDSEQTKRIRMHFVYKKVGAKKLVGAWDEGMQANAGDQMAKLQPSLDQLNAWMVDLVKGDEMIFTSVPGKGLAVEVKGESKGVIEDEAFSMAFWSIFIGDKPPTDKLKQGLLGSS